MRKPSSLLVRSCGGQNKSGFNGLLSCLLLLLSPLKMLCPKWELTSESLVFRTFPKCLLLNLIPGLGCWFLSLLLYVHYRSWPDFKSMSPTALPTCTFTQLLSFHHLVFWPPNPAFSPHSGDLHNYAHLLTAHYLTGLLGTAEPGQTTLLVLRSYSSLAD